VSHLEGYVSGEDEQGHFLWAHQKWMADQVAQSAVIPVGEVAGLDAHGTQVYVGDFVGQKVEYHNEEAVTIDIGEVSPYRGSDGRIIDAKRIRAARGIQCPFIWLDLSRCILYQRAVNV